MIKPKKQVSQGVLSPKHRSKPMRINVARKGVPRKQLKSILCSLPSIDGKQLKNIRPYISPKTYKKLKKFSIFIGQNIIDDLRKETDSFVEMITDIASDAGFSNLVEKQ